PFAPTFVPTTTLFRSQHGHAGAGESFGEVAEQGGLPGGAGAVDRDEQALAHAAALLWCSPWDSSTRAARTSSTVASPNWIPLERSEEHTSELQSRENL